MLMGIGNYSGVNNPPMYGDYEAQRHWMELTINLPTRDWYREVPGNNLTYWRIDYPPLQAYHAYLFGYLSNLFDQESVKFITSHGYENPKHKWFMRMSVLISCIVFYMSGLTFFVMKEMKKFTFSDRLKILLLVLCSPMLILIDHGHF